MNKKITLLCLSLILIVSVGAKEKEKVNQSSYPEFSWDKVPVYMHVSKGYGSEDFTDEELKRLADFPLIAIEKNQGHKKHGSLEAGTLVAAKGIKAINPNAKILFYFNSVVDYGKFYATGVILADENHPEWAQKTVKGEYVLHRDAEVKRMYDFSHPALRYWWVKTIFNATNSEYLDGVFIDGLPKIAASPTAKERNLGKEKYWAHYNGFHTAMAALKKKYNGEKIMIGNALRGYTDMLSDMGLHFLDYLDGGMIEGFGIKADMPAKVIANQITILQEASKRGKISIVAASPDRSDDKDVEFSSLSKEEKHKVLQDKIELPLAVFLVGAGEYSYFFYSVGYREDSGSMDYFDELNRPLGPPKGLAKKKGWVYTREFEHASVWVDVNTKEAKITWENN